MMTAKDKNKAYELIENALEKRKELLENKDDSIRNYFKSEAPPVLWFGDLNAEKPKVVVISANPNNPHEEGRIIPEGSSWDEKNPKIENLIDAYNNYFNTKPKTTWFGKKVSDIKQGRIEDFLKGLGASFYDRGDDYDQAIHIDLLPFATVSPFKTIADELMEIDGLREFINEHISELIKLINPKLVIVNGVTNKNYFEKCLKVKASKKPEIYESFTVDNKNKFNLTIWDFDNINIEDSKVIAISRNMGTSCYVSKESLYSIAEQERKRLKL